MITKGTSLKDYEDNVYTVLEIKEKVDHGKKRIIYDCMNNETFDFKDLESYEIKEYYTTKWNQYQAT